MAAMAPASLKLEIVEIGQLPLFNQDLEASPTRRGHRVQGSASRAPTPCCSSRPNTTAACPGVLKNAIDVASRPYGKSAWNGKPGAVVSVSPGAIGAFGANHQLRQSLVFLNVPALPHEAYIGNAAKLFDDKGALIADDTREFLSKFLQLFEKWIERNAAPRT